MCLSGKVYIRRVINSVVLIGKSHVNSVKKSCVLRKRVGNDKLKVEIRTDNNNKDWGG